MSQRRKYRKGQKRFDHFGLLAVCRLIPLRMGITSPTTIVSGRSDVTAYICEQSIVLHSAHLSASGSLGSTGNRMIALDKSQRSRGGFWLNRLRCWPGNWSWPERDRQSQHASRSIRPSHPEQRRPHHHGAHPDDIPPPRRPQQVVTPAGATPWVPPRTRIASTLVKAIVRAHRWRDNAQVRRLRHRPGPRQSGSHQRVLPGARPASRPALTDSYRSHPRRRTAGHPRARRSAEAIPSRVGPITWKLDRRINDRSALPPKSAPGAGMIRPARRAEL